MAVQQNLLASIDPKFKPKPMIISVALTGAVPSKSKYPTLPTEPREIAEAALSCGDLGASVVHLHMRDADGRQVQDEEKLLESIQLIRAGNPSLVICATSTSRGANSMEDRLTALRLPEPFLPDMVSLTLGSYNTPSGVNLNPREEIEEIASSLSAAGIAPELEIFEPGMMYTFFRMFSQQKIEKPALVNILLGVDGASPANARELLHIADLVPEDTEWAVAGIGAFQKRTVWLGAVLGGNVRVGMEDDPRGESDGWTNEDSVRRAVSAARAVDRQVASPAETRLRLGLAQRTS
jgi:3-keto-5-aminohexanoate cleavage enzyme